MKKIILSITGLIFFIGIVFIGLAAIDRGTKYTKVHTLVNISAPKELCYYYTNDGYSHTFFYKDSNTIQKFHNTIINKAAAKISDLPDEEKTILSFDYGQKGSTIYIDIDGSAYISADVAGIRNKSILHWLWWKIYAPDKAYFIYKIQPDKNLIDLAHNIKSDIETGITNFIKK